MEYVKKFLSETLDSGQVIKGTVYNNSQLAAKFQVWSRQYDLTNSESLACLIKSEPDAHLEFFNTSDEVNRFAKKGFSKIQGIDIPDLSNI